MTFSTLIDDVLSRLQDDGTVFSRAEIMRWLSASYRQLTAKGRHVRTFTALDMPPRHARAITFTWEKDKGLGSWRKWTYSYGHSEYTMLWEVEQAAGMTPTPSRENVSNLWEIAYTDGEVDAHYRFMLPKAEASIISVWQDGEHLSPTTARHLDSLDDRWWFIGGLAQAWHQTLSDESSFEVWETDSTYHQSFEFPDGELGIPRSWAEDDHTFEVEGGELGYGIFRGAYSENRQYFAAGQWEMKGTVRSLGKSDDGILVYHHVYSADTVNEDEEPVMIPAQMAKYLVYDALAVLLNRQGEGYDPALAAHYELRAARGIQVLRKLGMVTRIDASYTRGGASPRPSRPPLPQLPSNFPRAPWLRR